MNIAVLIKQVPDTQAALRPAAGGRGVDFGDARLIMNPYDEYALEEALRIREKHSGTVCAFCAGSARAVEVLRTALAMGADRAVLINDPALNLKDGLAVASALAAAIRRESFDLVCAGNKSVDAENGLVGPAVAEYLGLGHVPAAISAAVEDGFLVACNMVEGGTVTLRVPLPALFTAQKGLNEPRFPSMVGIMKAKKKPIETLDLNNLGLSAESVLPETARQKIAAVYPAPERASGRIIEGASVADKAEALVICLAKEAKVLA